jgi:hypothetical protein
MYITITTVTLALLIVAMLALRIVWSRIPSPWRKFLIRASLVLVVVHILAVVTKWETSSDRINLVLDWLAIAGYVLLILLLTRLSPRWLTSLSAVILILPLFSANILLPLTQLFVPRYNDMVAMGDTHWYQINPWSNAGAGIAGVDLQIYYRPRFAPFLRYRFQATPFNELQCNTKAAFALPGPSPKTVLARCPYWPSQRVGYVDEILPLSQSTTRLTRVP